MWFFSSLMLRYRLRQFWGYVFRNWTNIRDDKLPISKFRVFQAILIVFITACLALSPFVIMELKAELVSKFLKDDPFAILVVMLIGIVYLVVGISLMTSSKITLRAWLSGKGKWWQ